MLENLGHDKVMKIRTQGCFCVQASGNDLVSTGNFQRPRSLVSAIKRDRALHSRWNIITDISRWHIQFNKSPDCVCERWIKGREWVTSLNKNLSNSYFNNIFNRQAFDPYKTISNKISETIILQILGILFAPKSGIFVFHFTE